MPGCTPLRILIVTAWIGLNCFGQSQPGVFEHPDDSRIWLSGQINVIHQQHPAFSADYTGANSLKPGREKATSRVLTLYTGLRLTNSTEVLFDAESAGGR